MPIPVHGCALASAGRARDHHGLLRHLELCRLPNVLSGFACFLQADGRIIIVNLPSRGIREEFSEKGLKTNDELYPFLAEQNLIAEYKDFPCRPKDGTDESEELIVLVARKEKGKVTSEG